MTDSTPRFRSIKSGKSQSPSEEAFEALDQLRSRAEELIDGVNFEDIGRRIQEFGRRNPTGLALAALGVGLAAGLLMRGKFGSET